ncbi:DUF4431 domain-containing protein [Leeia sp.]|uniref:DUF4431 domain-containing protein n=1 Tax=Leeia sp. TaxID=2884678 RepID=UPI0035AFEB38
MTFRWFALLAAFSLAPAARAADCLHYAGAPLTLTGTVTLKTFYGPPNYGESPKTDAREVQAVLVLPKPICVAANPQTEEEAETGQRLITLVPPAGMRFKPYQGKTVVLTGTLFHAITGHHHTPVLMEVTRVTLK